MINTADITHIVQTKDEAIQLQIEIANLIEALFSNKPFEELVDEQIQYGKKEKLTSLLWKYNIDIKNILQTQHFLQEVKDIIATLPIVTVTIAFSPKKQQITTFSTLLYMHIKKPVLLDIFVDKLLIGGVIIAYNGIYKDYSVKRQVEEKYKNTMHTLL